MMVANVGLLTEFDVDLGLPESPDAENQLMDHPLLRKSSNLQTSHQTQNPDPVNLEQSSLSPAIFTKLDLEASSQDVSSENNWVLQPIANQFERHTTAQAIDTTPTKLQKSAQLQLNHSTIATPSRNEFALLNQNSDWFENQSVKSQIPNSNVSALLNQRSGWLNDEFGGSQGISEFGCSCYTCCTAGASDFSHLVSNADASLSDVVDLNVPKSGNLGIDALLSGRKWTATTITYSFYDGGPYYGTTNKLSELTDVLKGYIRQILEETIEPLINVDFVEVSDAGDKYGQIRYMYEDGAGFAYTKSLSNSPTGGDIFLDSDRQQYNFEAGPGSSIHETLIHETMHAVGLKHPGDYNGSGTGQPPFLPYNEDNRNNALMSYNRPRVGDVYYGGITPLTYDIRALQYLYGSKAHQESNTTYKFETVSGYTINGKFFGHKDLNIKQTIWDTQGLDSVDFSGLALNTSGYRFDLNEGGWLTTQDAHNGASYQARNDNSGQTYFNTAYGTAIAYNVMIENIVNSSSNDRIILNKAANTISGYTAGRQVGHDVIVNGNSQDTLDLSSYKASAVTQTISGNDLILNLGSNGSITLKGYQSASQTDRIKILWDGNSPPIDKTVIGTDGNDQLEGTAGNDLIRGLKGDDTIKGRAGSDELHGGDGVDTILGGNGKDRILGGNGKDILTGGADADMLIYHNIDHGGDTITDFELAQDKLDLSTIFSDAKYGSTNVFSDYIQVLGTTNGAQVRVDTLGDTGDNFKLLATLQRVDANSLNASHFVL